MCFCLLSLLVFNNSDFIKMLLTSFNVVQCQYSSFKNVLNLKDISLKGTICKNMYKRVKYKNNHWLPYNWQLLNFTLSPYKYALLSRVASEMHIFFIWFLFFYCTFSLILFFSLFAFALNFAKSTHNIFDVVSCKLALNIISLPPSLFFPYFFLYSIIIKLKIEIQQCICAHIDSLCKLIMTRQLPYKNFVYTFFTTIIILFFIFLFPFIKVDFLCLLVLLIFSLPCYLTVCFAVYYTASFVKTILSFTCLF